MIITSYGCFDSCIVSFIMLEMRKMPRRSVSHHDRIIKSDTEDKSLSNDETPLPSCPRQPPDGVETPSDVVEKMPEPQTRVQSRITVGWPSTTRTRFSYSSRTQDARSEASVKDKIAMFSNDHSTSSDRLDKCGTLPTRNSTTRKSNAYINNYSDVSSLDRRLTRSQDNLDEVPRSFKLCTERREVLGAMEITPTQNSTITKITRPLHTDNKPLFYGSTTTLPANSDSTFTPPIYHARSISDDNSNKNVHKSNLEYLIEQRKKSMSKLRGLVISEAQAPIVDLPAIKVQEPVTKSFNAKLNQSNINNRENKINNIKPIDLNDTKWKTTLLSNNIPKYSPAFKRKSLQVYSPGSLSKESTPERKLYTKTDNKNNNLLSTSKHTKTSLELNTDVTRTTSTLTSESILKCQVPKKEYKDIFNPVRDYKNVDIKISTAADIVDSDNDSAMSSTQSSYRSSASSPMNNLEAVESDSSRLSPRISSHYTHYSHAKAEIPIKSPIIEKNCEEYIKRNVCRSVSSDTNVSLSSSAGSAATSGSQASCSSLESSVTDSEKRKVSKSYNIDTINRRNILASAKCRSGRDDKLKSPVIEAKFSHESVDSPPSPVYKATDRLSTLTSSVSAVSNKGENRRRNKKIAETDSDSDSDVNIRQRKTDYKNTRLKRNASYSNKIKQTENTLEVTKIDDVPKNISEKIIKEIKKVGLDNIKTKEHIQTVNNSLSSKINECIIKKEDDNIKHPKINNLLHSEKSTNSIDKQEICVDTTKAKLNDISSEDVKIPICTVSLKRGAASGVGLILAGGIDCEAKDVTIHRVLADSVADKAGLKRGSKVRSINGYVMAGLTHAQSVTILKEQRSEVVIEIEDESRKNNANEARYGSENAESKVRQEANKTETVGNKASNVVTVLLEKAGGGAGLGFGLDGGRDSPHGDRPLTIKKLFAGGAAAQSGRVLVGAELLSAGGQSMEGFTRTQAWAALKALPSGTVALVLKNPKTT